MLAEERHLVALPLRFGSLGICNPVSLATNLFNSSVHTTEHLVNSIVGIGNFELDSHFDCISFNKKIKHQ